MFLDSNVTHCFGGGGPAEGGGSSLGWLAEAKGVGAEAWVTCCCLAVGGDACAGFALAEALKALR